MRVSLARHGCALQKYRVLDHLARCDLALAELEVDQPHEERIQLFRKYDHVCINPSDALSFLGADRLTNNTAELSTIAHAQK